MATAPLHFIGEGTGAVVTSAAVERLARFEVPVDQVTYLDPHDYVQVGLSVDSHQSMSDVGAPDGYGAAVWNNVAFTDVYYQTRGHGPAGTVVSEGRPIPGAYNRELRNGDELPDSYAATDVGNDHDYVWKTFYVGTVLGHRPDLSPNSAKPDLDTEFAQHSTGFGLTRLGGGRLTRQAQEFAPISTTRNCPHNPC
jgi:hypothetical protein